MIKIKSISRTKFVPETITCNKCGFTQEVEDTDSGRDFTLIHHKAGYCSNHDGDSFSSHICEPCILVFYESFTTPPLVIPAGASIEDLEALSRERSGELHIVYPPRDPNAN